MPIIGVIIEIALCGVLLCIIAKDIGELANNSK